MTIRPFTKLVVAFSVICATDAITAFAADRERPNIVFFLIDDCSTHEFGCYGNKKNPTPNVDRLAQEGIRFKSAWATPVCMPTRAELFSGQYGFRNGCYDNVPVQAKLGDLPNKITPLSKTLQQAGYATFMGGKWHLEGLPGDQAWGFDEYLLYGSLCEAAAKNRDWKSHYKGPWWPYTWTNKRVLAQPEGACSPYATWHPMIVRNGQIVETGPDDFGPDILGKGVDEFIQGKAKEKRPFFVYYAEHLTHAPQTSMFDPESPTKETEPGMDSNVRYVDKVIGRLVEALKRAGVWENTVLFVAGDNPTDMMGKGFSALVSAHVPLIISGGKKWVTWQGESGCLTDFTDIYPTCMELAGLDPARNSALNGKSLKPLLDGDKQRTRPWIFSYLGIYRMIRDEKWGLDGLSQLWRCNDSGDPFTFKLIAKDQEDAEAVRGRAGLEDLLKGLPAPTEAEIDASFLLTPQREANLNGKNSFQQNFQFLYNAGVSRMLNYPNRKEGPTRAMIDGRFSNTDEKPTERPKWQKKNQPVQKP